MNKSIQRYKMPADFETISECRSENATRTKHLRMADTPESRALALRLEECTRMHPCGSGACRLCSRSTRKGIFGIVKSFAESSDLPCHFVTIVYFQDAMTDAQLESWNPLPLKGRLRKLLHRAGLQCPVVGSCELDYQSDIERWMPHFHLHVFASYDEIDVIRPLLLKKNRLKGLDRKHTPLRIDRIKRLDDLITYIYMFIWLERKRFLGNLGYRTRKKRLQPQRHALALLTLDRLGFSGLRFSSGVPRYKHPLCMEFVSNTRQRRGS